MMRSFTSISDMEKAEINDNEIILLWDNPESGAPCAYECMRLRTKGNTKWVRRKVFENETRYQTWQNQKWVQGNPNHWHKIPDFSHEKIFQAEAERLKSQQKFLTAKNESRANYFKERYGLTDPQMESIKERIQELILSSRFSTRKDFIQEIQNINIDEVYSQELKHHPELPLSRIQFNYILKFILHEWLQDYDNTAQIDAPHALTNDQATPWKDLKITDPQKPSKLKSLYSPLHEIQQQAIDLSLKDYLKKLRNNCETPDLYVRALESILNGRNKAGFEKMQGYQELWDLIYKTDKLQAMPINGLEKNVVSIRDAVDYISNYLSAEIELFDTTIITGNPAERIKEETLNTPLSVTKNTGVQAQFNKANQTYSKKAEAAIAKGQSPSPTFLQALQLISEITLDDAAPLTQEELLEKYGYQKIKSLRDALQIITSDKPMLMNTSRFFYEKIGADTTEHLVKDKILTFQATLLTIPSSTLIAQRKKELVKLISKIATNDKSHIQALMGHIRDISTFVRNHSIKEDKSITDESALVNLLIYLENAQPEILRHPEISTLHEEKDAKALETAHDALLTDKAGIYSEELNNLLDPILSSLSRFLPSHQQLKLDILKNIFGDKISEGLVHFNKETLFDLIHQNDDASPQLRLPLDEKTYNEVKESLEKLQEFYPDAVADIAILKELLLIRHTILTADYSIKTIQTLNNYIDMIDHLEQTPLVIETKKMLMEKFIESSRQELSERIHAETENSDKNLKAGTDLIKEITRISNAEIKKINNHENVNCSELRKQYGEKLANPIEAFCEKQKKQSLTSAVKNFFMVIFGIGILFRGAQIYNTDKSFFFYSKDQEIKTQKTKKSLTKDIFSDVDVTANKKSGKAGK